MNAMIEYFSEEDPMLSLLAHSFYRNIVSLLVQGVYSLVTASLQESYLRVISP